MHLSVLVSGVIDSNQSPAVSIAAAVQFKKCDTSYISASSGMVLLGNAIPNADKKLTTEMVSIGSRCFDFISTCSLPANLKHTLT